MVEVNSVFDRFRGTGAVITQIEEAKSEQCSVTVTASGKYAIRMNT
jgi:hypothetical protein